ncbi:MAG: cell division protein ZipA [Idiomarina sp.]|nr:cell division protein ZipA [Idiomarina sp.]
MDSMRTVLIIIGLMIILALLAHGLLTIRRNNQAAKDRREQVERKRRRSSEDLFSQNETVDESTLQDPLKPRPSRKQRAVHVEQANADDSVRAQVREPELDLGLTDDLFAQQDLAADIEQMEIDLEDDTFAQRQQAPTRMRSEADNDQAEALLDDVEPRTLSADESGIDSADELDIDLDEVVTRDAFEDDPEQLLSDDEEHLTRQADKAPSADKKQAPTQKAPDMEVITLFVTGDIQGAILLQMTAELGLKYGDMDIFHRHQESSGHGPVLFSVANMFNPGTFDITNMERFHSQGIVLFMTLPLKSDGHQAFTMMYNAANKIADAMPRAAVLDGNRNPVTKQSVQHTYQRIREFERKQRLQKPSVQW